MQTKILLCGRAVLLAVIYFSTTIFLSSCGDNKADSSKIMIKNGLICTIDNGEPYTGKVHDVISSRVLEYDVVKGIKEGEFNVYSVNGKILISGRIKQNKNEGLWQYFYPDGDLESQGYFKNDNTSDKWIWYYPDGKLKQTGFYLDGKKEGKWIKYNEYGKIISEEVYRNNVKIAGMEDRLT